MKKAIYFLLATLVIIATFYLVSPHLPDSYSCREVSGKVSAVYSSTKENVMLKMSGIRTGFQFISQSGKLRTESLREALLGKDVTITYFDRWTPLDPSAKRSISSVAIGGEIVYSEPMQP
jgi:hypothetical protein